MKRAALLVLLFPFAQAATAAEAHLKAGVGTGLPYGSPSFGAGLELELGEHLGLLGGAGFFGRETPWAYGVRLYPLGGARRWRPHVSALHWTEGNGLYVGVDRRFAGERGFVGTIAVGFGDVNQEGSVHLMLGLGYRF